MTAPVAAPAAGPRVSARLRLTLAYATVLVMAGAVTLAGVWVVLRTFPNYPLTAANPRDESSAPSRAEVLDALVSVSVVLVLVLSVVGLAVGWVLAGRVLRPLQEINAAARIAAAGRLDHRIAFSGPNDEFRQLADNVNAMFARLEADEHARLRFVANASHELRTPLSVTATLLEVAGSDPAGADRTQLLERLRVTNERAVGLTDGLLQLAEITATGTASAQVRAVDLAPVVADHVAEQEAAAAAHDVVLEQRTASAPAWGDPVLLGMLVGNLVQNAVRHCTRAGTAVISTGRGPGTAWVRTENPGRTHTAELAARLTEPFLRGAGRVSVRDDGGHGLGLALVEEIVRVHGGTVAVVPRPGGGLVVTATVPCPPAACGGPAAPRSAGSSEASAASPRRCSRCSRIGPKT